MARVGTLPIVCRTILAAQKVHPARIIVVADPHDTRNRPTGTHSPPGAFRAQCNGSTKSLTLFFHNDCTSLPVRPAASAWF